MGDRAALLRGSFEMVVERDPQFTARFYDVLFARYPQARSLFRRNKRGDQERMLGEALGAVLDHLEDAPWLAEHLAALGARHQGYGVTSEMYGWVGQALLQALSDVMADDWTSEMQEAWAEAFTSIARLMSAGVIEERAEVAAPTA